ncbi:MAG TPA: glycosyltransferase, partial [Planctomycetota bacterium]|nr:glycosyltransferase [Planctomycetota bacterium]
MRRAAFGKMRSMEMSATTEAGAPVRVLMVCYHFPPMSSTGSLRVARFARYLPPDIAIEVLTVANPPEETGNRALLAELAGRVTIHKAALPARFTPRWVERMFSAVPLGELLAKTLRTLLTFTLWIPDWQVLWRKPALHVGGRLLGAGTFDVIFCSSPPHSVHLIGLELKRRFEVPLVVDFRDPWSANPGRRGPTVLHRLHERELESRVLAGADLVIANTPGNRERLLADFAGLAPEKVVVLPNGYDPARREGMRPSAAGAGDGRRRVVYTGHLYDDGDAVMRALEALQRSDPDLHRRVVFRFVGTLDAGVAARAAELQADGLVETLSFVSAERVPEEIAAADALLYVVPPAGEHWIPSKLYDYFLAERPIIGVLPRGDAWNWLERSGLGTLIEDTGVADVTRGLRACLTRLQRGQLAARPDREFIARFDAREQSQELA